MDTDRNNEYKGNHREFISSRQAASSEAVVWGEIFGSRTASPPDAGSFHLLVH
jgi:hypothetical protein